MYLRIPLPSPIVDLLDQYWDNLVLALIGEMIDDSDEVCGCRVVDKSNKKGNQNIYVYMYIYLICIYTSEIKWIFFCIFFICFIILIELVEFILIYWIYFLTAIYKLELWLKTGGTAEIADKIRTKMLNTLLPEDGSKTVNRSKMLDFEYKKRN
jgi:hypothetical protein